MNSFDASTNTVVRRAGGSTPFPNILLDTFMPLLTDTEWRVLCVVVRQTLGWRAANPDEDSSSGRSATKTHPNQVRKRSDWISQRQLMKRTGRASEAVSKAIEGLVRKHLLDIRAETGEDMSSPQARRRNCGKLWYQLPEYLLGDNSEHKPYSPFRVRKSNTTKVTFNKIYKEYKNTENGPYSLKKILLPDRQD
jgi:hypothetical protein